MAERAQLAHELSRLTLPDRRRQRRADPPKGPRAVNLRIRRNDSYGNAQAPIPERLLLILPVPGDASSDLLFLDHLPLPREAWHYDEADQTLSWRGAFGGGHLYFTHEHLGATGNVGAADTPVSVTGSSATSFLCDVALNTGASYLSDGGKIVGFTWDPTSPQWQSAQWVKQRLLLSYTVTPGGPMDPPTITFEFTDEQTQSKPWAPGVRQATTSLKLAENKGGGMVWALSFLSRVSPGPDKGSHPPIGPGTVYPWWMQAVENASMTTINGVLLIDKMPPDGTLVGMEGLRLLPAASGYYRTSEDTAPFGVFDGRLMIDGRAAGRSWMQGSELSWSGLDPEHQQRTGLPESGSLQFTPDGSQGAADDHSLSAHRLRAGAIAAAIARHSNLHPDLHRRITAMTTAAGGSTLTIHGLLAMSPFVRGLNGSWSDVVQAAVTSDLSDIMNSFIPTEMWDLIFGGQKRQPLPKELQDVANTPVPPSYPYPGLWYSQLATAVVTQGLAGGSDPACAHMNGPRAATWLKTEVAASKVYKAHSQLLFHYEWERRFTETRSYLADQIQNAPAYETEIKDRVDKQIREIVETVAVDANSPPHLIETLKKQVQDIGDYAITKKLYWAFAYYIYNTTPTMLDNIAAEIGMYTGSSDGTTLTRLIQQNMSVLTALDGTGFFARQYTATLNTFLTTNILPSMFGFTGDAMAYDVVKRYLDEFVAANINNENQQIAEAARQIRTILDADDASAILHTSIEALQAFSDAALMTLELPYIAENFVDWFGASYKQFPMADLFGSALIGGVVALGIVNVINDFKQWDQLTTSQKTGVILDATQLGLETFAAVVTRGVRVSAMFGVDGMTAMQRAGAIGRILVTGGAEKLDMGLVKIGNSTARWLGDTEGTIGKLAVIDHGVVTAVIDNAGTMAADEAGWASKIFGKNLDEFVATRIGPVLIIAGIGLSLTFIIEGETGVALASDILNIVGGSLTLFAMVGEWAIGAGYLAAEGVMATIIAIAGPLALIAALAGLGLLLYQLFKKKPDPVQKFVDLYARPAGFEISAKATAIDFALVYPNPERSSLLMIGFTLSAGGQTLECKPDGSLSLRGSPTALPDCVWVSQTDGIGQSQIMTVVQPVPGLRPVSLWLSLMSDNSVSFQPKLLPASMNGPAQAAPGGPAVVTQTWLSAPQGNASFTSKGDLVSLGLTLRAVRPDQSGNYKPSNAAGWLVAGSGHVSYSTAASTTFTLQMSALAPNFMTMASPRFLLDTTPSTMETFGPTFGMPPSTPVTYSHAGTLPPFLEFDRITGTFSPNGGKATAQQQYSDTITATNAAGSASAPFTISVAPPPPPPAPLPAPA